MNTEWAVSELKRFVDLTDLVPTPKVAGMAILADTRRIKGNAAEVVASAQVAEQILDRVVPGWRDIAPQTSIREWQREREAAMRAIAQLERASEIEKGLGDDSPTLDVGRLHPWVWEAARSLWRSGHYVEAVRASTIKINAEVQNKLRRRDLSEAALFRNAFSNDPPRPGQPRLVPPGDFGDDTTRGLRRGVAALAEGLFAILRNPASHEVMDEISEADAIEQLAALSLLARMVDASSVEFALPES